MTLRSRFDVLFAISLTMLSVLLHSMAATLTISAVVSLSTLTRWDHHVRSNRAVPGLSERLLVILEFWLAGAACALPAELGYYFVQADALVTAAVSAATALTVFYVSGIVVSRQVNHLWSANASAQ